MSYSKHDYQRAFEKFKSLNPDMWRRYETSAAAELLLAHLVSEQQPAGVVTIELGIKTLVRQGLLFRVDNKTAEDDKQEALDRIIARVDGPDLTSAEIEAFGSIHAQKLVELYWADGGVNEFAVRYRKAARLFGFRIPGRPTGMQA